MSNKNTETPEIFDIGFGFTKLVLLREVVIREQLKYYNTIQIEGSVLVNDGSTIRSTSGLAKNFGQHFVAGLVGSALADELLEGQINSEAEAVGVELGKFVGGIIGSYFGPIGTGVGTFIGAMAGDFAGEQWNELDEIWDKGNTIDNIADTTWQLINPEHALEHALNIITSYGKKTPPPTAHARMEWDAEQGEYVVVSSDSADGGNRQAMLDMAQAATAQVQALLEASGGQIIDPSQIQPITFSQHDGDFFFNGTGGNPNELISRAVISSLQQIEIEGGDSTIKRVIYETEATDLGEMMGQIQSGKKWELYTEETPVILNAQGEPVTDKEGVDAFKAAVASLEAGDLSGEEFSSSYTVSTYKSYVDNLLETDPESEAAQEWTQALQITEQFPLEGDHYSDDYSRLGYLAQHNGGFSLFDKDINDFVFEVNQSGQLIIGTRNRATTEQEQQQLDAQSGEVPAWSDLDNKLVIDDWSEWSKENSQLVLEDGTSINLTDYLEQLGITAGSGSQAVNIAADQAASEIEGSEGKDSYLGSGGDDQLQGSRGDDVIMGGAGDDRIDGGSGDDILVGGEGADLLKGGEGNDTAVYQDEGGVYVDLAKGRSSDGDTLEDIENITSGSGNDILIGNAEDNILNAGAGDDMLAGGAGADTLIGGEGTDTAAYGGSESGVTIDLGSGTGTGGDAEGDRLIDIENVTGSSHNDTLRGNDQDNKLDGGDGNDTLIGGGGDDRLLGGAGDDFLSGGEGDDHLYGGDGNDILLGGSGYDTAYFSGQLEDYAVQVLGKNSFALTDTEGNVKIISEVERMVFINAQGDPVSYEWSDIVDYYEQQVAQDQEDQDDEEGGLGGKRGVSGKPSDATAIAIAAAIGITATEVTAESSSDSLTYFDDDPADLPDEEQAAWAYSQLRQQQKNQDNPPPPPPEPEEEPLPSNSLNPSKPPAESSQNPEETEDPDGRSQEPPPAVDSSELTDQQEPTLPPKQQPPEQEPIKPEEKIEELVLNLGEAPAPSASDGPVQPSAAPQFTKNNKHLLEDQAIDLEIVVVPDHPDDNITIVVSGVPQDASLNAGNRQSDGDWILTPEQLNNLQVQVPEHWASDMQLQVTVNSSNPTTLSSSSQSQQIELIIDSVADQAELTFSSGDNRVYDGVSKDGTDKHADTVQDDSQIYERSGTELHLGISSIDAREYQYVLIEGIAEGDYLTEGKQVNDQDYGPVWQVTPEQFSALRLYSTSYGKQYQIQVRGCTVDPDPDTGREVRSVTTIEHTISGAPITSTENQHLLEDQSIPLVINLDQAHTDDQTQLRINQLPPELSLSAGSKNADGSWSLLPEELNGLQIQVPAHYASDIDIEVKLYTYNPTTGANSIQSRDLSVIIDSVSDEVHLEFSASETSSTTQAADNIVGTDQADTIYAGGDKDSVTSGAGNDTVYGDTSNSHATTALKIQAQTADTRESQFFVIRGVPEGDYLSAGEKINDPKLGTLWKLTPEQAQSVTLHSATDRADSSQESGYISNEDYSIHVYAYSIDIDPDTGKQMSELSHTFTEQTITLPDHAAADNLDGESGDDILYGEQGNDQLTGGEGADQLYGGTGDDTLIVDQHDTKISGGKGNDHVKTDVHSVDASLTWGLNVDSIEQATGNASDETFVALASQTGVIIDAGAGDDRVLGSTLDDTITGGAGADIIHSGAGDDLLYIDAADNDIDAGDDYDKAYVQGIDGIKINIGSSHIEWIEGNSGNDRIDNTGTTSTEVHAQGGDDWVASGGGADVLDGGTGKDTLSYKNSDAAVDINLSNNIVSGGYAEGDTIVGFENIEGSAFNDTLTGDSSDNVFTGNAGSDTIYGGAGEDVTVYAGDFLEYYNATPTTLLDLDIGAGSARITSLNGVDTDSVDTMEILRFDDRDVYLDGRNNDVISESETISVDASGTNLYEDVLSGTGISRGHALGAVTGEYKIHKNQLLANDSDVDGDTLDISAVSSSMNGSVRLDGDYIYFKPNRNFNSGNSQHDSNNARHKGEAQFEYTVSDGRGGETTATATLDIQAVNDAADIYHTSHSARSSSTEAVQVYARDVDSSLGLSDLGASTNRGQIVSRRVTMSQHDDANYSKFEFDVLGQVEHYSVHSGSKWKNTWKVTNHRRDHFGTVNVEVTDGSGQGEMAAIGINQSRFVWPIALDLDGDGLEFISLEDSTAMFDGNADGIADHTAWLGADDGWLAFDYDGDGKITKTEEIAFAMWHEDATSDLHGLALAFDSNKDGVFDSKDEHWGSFGVWQDANSDGISDEGEFINMEQTGIVSINLTSDGEAYTTADGDVEVVGETSYTKDDGSTGTVGDVALAYEQQTSEQQAPTASEQQQNEENGSEEDSAAQASSGMTAELALALLTDDDAPPMDSLESATQVLMQPLAEDSLMPQHSTEPAETETESDAAETNPYVEHNAQVYSEALKQVHQEHMSQSQSNEEEEFVFYLEETLYDTQEEDTMFG